VLGVEAGVFDSAENLLAQADGRFVSRGKLDAANDRANPFAK
jgi:hypothetical protein